MEITAIIERLYRSNSLVVADASILLDGQIKIPYFAVRRQRSEYSILYPQTMRSGEALYAVLPLFPAVGEQIDAAILHAFHAARKDPVKFVEERAQRSDDEALAVLEGRYRPHLSQLDGEGRLFIPKPLRPPRGKLWLLYDSYVHIDTFEAESISLPGWWLEPHVSGRTLFQLRLLQERRLELSIPAPICCRCGRNDTHTMYCQQTEHTWLCKDCALSL